MAYTITNTAGDSVISVQPTETSGSALPVEIVGQNYSGYGQIIGNNFLRLTENFANTTPPGNPVEGMFWYDQTKNVPHFRNTEEFVRVETPYSSGASLFEMAATAQGIDLTKYGSAALFTNPGRGKIYYPTGLLVTPVGTPSATGPAMVNLQVKTAEDIMENVQIYLTTSTQYAFYSIQGRSERIDGSNAVYLEVVGPAEGGDLSVDVKLFGFMV